MTNGPRDPSDLYGVKADTTGSRRSSRAALCRLSCWFVSSGANARWAQVGGALRKYSAHVGAEAPSRRPGTARSRPRLGPARPPAALLEPCSGMDFQELELITGDPWCLRAIHRPRSNKAVRRPHPGPIWQLQMLGALGQVESVPRLSSWIRPYPESRHRSANKCSRGYNRYPRR